MKNTHCVVLAGGQGTRVSAITGDTIPKALLRVADHAFLHYKIQTLRAAGFREITFLLGKLSQQIVEFIEDYPSSEIKMNYQVEKTPLGTGGSISNALSLLPDTFWVTYADSLVFPDTLELSAVDQSTDSRSSIMCVLKNRNQWGRSNVDISGQFVSCYANLIDGDYNSDLDWIDYGLLRLSCSNFENMKSPVFDLSEVIQSQIRKGKMRHLICNERFREIGTPESYEETCEWVRENWGT